MKKILILLPFLLVGCNQTNLKELQSEINFAESNDMGYLPEQVLMPPPIVAVYRGAGLKSPFRNSISEVKTSKKVTVGIKPDLDRKKTKFEDFPLSSFVLLGTIKSESDESLDAIVNLNGQTHIISKGFYIGKNNGKIKDIKDNSIELEEIVSNGSYRWVKRPAQISMLNN